MKTKKNCKKDKLTSVNNRTKIIEGAAMLLMFIIALLIGLFGAFYVIYNGLMV